MQKIITGVWVRTEGNDRRNTFKSTKIKQKRAKQIKSRQGNKFGQKKNKIQITSKLKYKTANRYRKADRKHKKKN